MATDEFTHYEGEHDDCPIEVPHTHPGGDDTTERYTINRPVRFAGTEDERLRNYYSHDWIYYDHEEPPECGRCCAKSWHVAASYPCGQEPPRETIEVGG